MQSVDSSSSHRGALSLLTPIGASYYARSKALDTQHYQQLMDRGWRRSGTLLYLPDASRSCCPHYTIRLPASEFRPSRDQRQTLHRWNRYILGEKYIAEASKRYPKTKDEKRRQNTTFDLVSAIHESEHSHLKPDIQPAHRFEVSLEPDRFTKEKFALFSDYQRHVHHEGDADISESGFKRFLCSSPLTRPTSPASDAQPQGSFHQCYRLDGRLVAMAVLDLLPHAVSGVYFIYHRDLERWSPGKLSALREAALALERGGGADADPTPQPCFYYMGYYIHACPKMRYKADFRPQHVLDYHTLGWDVLDDGMRALMDRGGYASMSRERERERRAMEEGRGGGGKGEWEDTDDDDDDDDDDPDDDEQQIPFPRPLDAVASGVSLLELRVPGVMTLGQLRAGVDLDRVGISLGRDGVYEMRHITTWSSGDVLDPSSLKGMMAELAAALGPVANEVVVDFGS